MQSAPDSDQHNEKNMDARPDQEEMGQAINQFLQQLEKQIPAAVGEVLKKNLSDSVLGIRLTTFLCVEWE